MSYNQFTKRDFLEIIKYPLGSSKAIRLWDKKQYSFAVDSKSDKFSLKLALEKLFDVKVVSVSTSLLPIKKCRVGKFKGKKARYKRAIFKLASGDSIVLLEKKTKYIEIYRYLNINNYGSSFVQSLQSRNAC